MSGVVVSVVMPSLNQGRYVTEAVRSVLEQHCRNLELIVADGGSGDDTLAQLARLGDAFPGRLRWYSEPDGGPADAINKAVGRARGQIIGWLNSDDLYARGAVARAVRHMQKDGDCAMVYGHAKHIDAQGRVIGRYPTRLPSSGISEFADGCFICQPSVFFRREAFDALGGLDTSLGASFDFDLWLRFFSHFPDRIGFIPRVQAYSRLHEECITRRFRERIALEGMAVVSRHLGAAPAHWLLTHFEELFVSHPFQSESVVLADEVNRLATNAGPCLSASARETLKRRVDGDRRLALATREIFVDCHPDGWAAPELEVRVRQSQRPIHEIVLACRHAGPAKRPLQLMIGSPDGEVRTQVIREKGQFEIRIPVNERAPDARLIFKIRTRDWFIPSKHSKGSDDQRRLAYLVERCELAAAEV